MNAAFMQYDPDTDVVNVTEVRFPAGRRAPGRGSKPIGPSLSEVKDQVSIILFKRYFRSLW
jgi:hypothetical protein